MAIVKFGGGVSGIRGTIAGNTFSANKSGAFAKNWSRGPNPRTTSQTSNRIALAKLAADWAAVPSTDKADWDTFASLPAQELTNALGDPYFISGFLWFIKCNKWLASAGYSPVTVFPTSTYPTAPVLTTISALTAATSIITEWTSGTGSPARNIVYYASPALTTGRTAPQARGKLFGHADYIATYAINLSTAWDLTFGYATPGQKVFLTAYVTTIDGLRSAPATINAIFV